MGRLIDADILIAELKESALHHCNNPREDSLLQRDRVIVRAQPTVEAIPQAEYENRLKADLKAILVKLQLEINEIPINPKGSEAFKLGQATAYDRCEFLIRQKIEDLKEVEDGNVG